MKKIISIVICICTVLSIMPTVSASVQDVDTTVEEFELWAMSPCISGGMSREDLVFQKALQGNFVQFYDVPKLGARYKLAATYMPIYNTGPKGRDTFYDLTYYLLYVTDDGYEIISYANLLSDYMNPGTYFADISDKIGEGQAGDKPLYLMTGIGVYSYDSWSWWSEYIVLTDKKQLVKYQEYQKSKTMTVYNGILYWTTPLTSGYYYLYRLYFNGNSCSLYSGVSVASEDATAEKGFFSYATPFDNDTSNVLYNLIKEEDTFFSYKTNGNYNVELNFFKRKNGDIERVETGQINSTEYMTINNYSFSNVTVNDKDYYRDRGYSVPCLILLDRYIITDTGVIARLRLDTSIYYSTSYYQFATYKGRLAIVRYTNGRSYIVAPDETGTQVYWQAVNYVTVKPDGQIELSEDILLPMPYTTVPNEGQNGYYYSYSRFVASTDISYITGITAVEHFGRTKGNTFSDGKIASGSWRSNGANYEYWYYIYLPDGRLCATGPTGYYASTSDYDPFIIVENDSKFVVGSYQPIDNHIREFYKVATVQNTDTGEATLVGASIGRKNISSEIVTDTEPVQSIIDFSKDDLPIGFNVRDNVIDADNFTVDTREQFNSIRLSDIVILKNGRQQSGTQNTGSTLDAFNTVLSDFGNANIRFYTNGQNFGWTASDTTNLNTGTYNKYFVIGDKTVYVTIKIVDVPSSNGTTTVVF